MSNTTSPDVSRGSDGTTLFLVGGKQHVLPYISGEKPLNPHLIGSFRADIMKRKIRCERFGASYAHIVAPDKHSVIPELFPHDISVGVGSVYKDACGDLFDFPIAAFRRLGTRRGYLRTDSHWNADGIIAFVGRALHNLDVSSEIFAAAMPAIDAMRYQTRLYGDLGKKLQPQEFEKCFLLGTPDGVHLFSNNVTDNNGKIFVTFNIAAPLERLLVFGDSFSISCVGVFSLIFKEVLMVRSTNFHIELLSLFQPTHVITENVERYLPSMRPDSLAPNALLAPFILKKTMQPDAMFYEALNAALKPRSPQHDIFVESLYAAREAAAPAQ